MVFLPVVTRELRVATRSPRIYWVRVTTAVLAVGLVALMMSSVQVWSALDGTGRSIFKVLSGLAFGGCLIAGVFITGPCLCEEKHQGTLDLLFLTRLRPLHVILGKLTANSAICVQVLLGLLPMLALTLPMGGVSVGEFWRMLLVLLNTFFLSLAVGMFVSAISWRRDRAMMGTLAGVLLIVVGLAQVDLALLGDWSRYAVGSILPGPWQAFTHAFDEVYSLPPRSFWQSVLITQVLAWFLLWQASRSVLRSMLRPPRALAADHWREGLMRWVTGEPPAARPFRRRWLRKNPMFWLFSRRRWNWIRLWTWLLCVGLVWTVLIARFGFKQGKIDFWLLVCLPIGLHLVIKVAVAAEAVCRLNQMRRTGELEVLLTTPVRTGFVPRGLMLALRTQFVAPLVLVLTIDTLLLFWGTLYSADMRSGSLSTWVPDLTARLSSAPFFPERQELLRALLLSSMMVLLLFESRALAWVGILQGLFSGTTMKALWRTLYRVLGIPCVVFVCTVPLAPPVLLHGTAFGRSDEWLLGAAAWWMVIGIATSLAFAIRAKRDLGFRLRRLAAFRYGQS